MKRAVTIFFALLLIAAGVLWILQITGLFSFEFDARGWWALLIILPCVFALFTDSNKIGPCVGIALGVLLALAARDVITWNMMWQIFLALMVIGFGLQILLVKKGCPHGVCEIKNVSRDGKDVRRIESSFGRQEFKFAGQKVEGIDVQSSFGGLTLDLRGAEIVGEAFIDLNVGFSGVTIILPENLPAIVSVSSGFGGVSDNRRVKPDVSGTPSLFITGKVGFGGVEIRN